MNTAELKFKQCALTLAKHGLTNLTEIVEDGLSIAVTHSGNKVRQSVVTILQDDGQRDTFLNAVIRWDDPNAITKMNAATIAARKIIREHRRSYKHLLSNRSVITLPAARPELATL